MSWIIVQIVQQIMLKDIYNNLRIMQLLLGNKLAVREKVHFFRNFFLSFSVSATGWSPYTDAAHHLFLRTVAFLLFMALLWDSGPRCCAVCTACPISQEGGRFAQAAQLLALFIAIISFLCRSESGQPPRWEEVSWIWRTFRFLMDCFCFRKRAFPSFRQWNTERQLRPCQIETSSWTTWLAVK